MPPGHIAVLAPLDGIVLSVAVAAGDQVAPGDELLVIESMKMEHPVQAEAAGQVQSVLMAVGVTVAAGTVLLVLAPSADDVADAGGPATSPWIISGRIWPRRGSGTGSGWTRPGPRRPGGGTPPDGGRPGRTSPTSLTRAASSSTAR